MTAVIAVLLCALMTALYWPGLHGSFFFDDEPNILQAEGLRLANLSLESLRAVLASGHSGPSGRPVAQLSFALNYYFNGFDAFYFKATNLAIHASSGLLAFFLALRLLGAASPQARRRTVLVAAGALAAAWLLHPIQLTPVLHVVQRMTSLSALFLLGALLCHISGRERAESRGVAWLLVAWGLLWPLSFFSKETGILFPLFAITWELIVRRQMHGGLDYFVRSLAVVLTAVVTAAAVYAITPFGQWLWAGYDYRSFTLGQRILTEGRVLWFYLGLIFFPRLEALGLYHDDIALSSDLLSPWITLPAWLGLISLVVLAWRIRRFAPLVTFGIVWFFVGHALESTFLPLEIAHEHRNYLPLFGILLAAAWAMVQTLTVREGPPKTVAVAVGAVALLYFSFITALRAHQFGNEERRTQIEAQHHRNSSRAQYEAGRTLSGFADAAMPESPVYSFARAHFEQAGKIDPDFKLSWLGLIQLNCRAGQPPVPTWIEELKTRLREKPLAPADSTVVYSLKEMSIASTICLSRADLDSLFSAALSNPGTLPGTKAMLYSWQADYLWLREGDMAAARDALGRSLALAPWVASNQLKWAQLLLISGEHEQAHKLLLKLQEENFSADERRTLEQLLATFKASKH